MAPKKNSLPEKFLERLPFIFGESVARQSMPFFIERPTTFRVNTLRAKRLDILHALQATGFKILPVAWYTDAFILQNKSKRDLCETELYRDGKIYLQSLASMAPVVALGPLPGERVLDLTAAPGSKTSQIAAFMNAEGELVANDSNEIRFSKLSHNMELLGVTADRPRWKFALHQENGVMLVKKFENYFDKILLDAPCSAEARFVAGESVTFGYWNERTIKEMAYKQRQLLLSAWNALKSGGTLVYSTCTFAPEENELQVERLLERHDTARVVPISWNGLKTLPAVLAWEGKTLSREIKKTCRLLPTKDTEGFYIAKIIKK